jgi:steroid delta-isomerase-like uncharacterized protein
LRRATRPRSTNSATQHSSTTTRCQDTRRRSRASRPRSPGYKAAFPDLTVDLGDVVADGVTVATRWTVAGSHEGEMMGIPATGKQIRVEGMNFSPLADGRITDVWTQFDGVSMLQQLGVIPTPEEASVR